MLDYMRISEEYRYKTELHAHTKPVSLCSEITPEEIVRAYYEYGCDTLTVTNHLNPDWTPSRTDEYLSGYYDTKKAAEGTGMNVVLGVEIRFTENANDYLVYGVSFGDIEKMIRLIPYGITEFYKEIKTRENIILQAHPFRNGMTLAPLDSIDGIETFNMHPGHNSRVPLPADMQPNTACSFPAVRITTTLGITQCASCAQMNVLMIHMILRAY